MANNGSAQPQKISDTSEDEVKKVALQLEIIYHSITSIYDLGIDAMDNPDSAHLLTAIRGLARSCARDLEACAEKLSGDKLGFFEDKFGAI